MQKKISGLLGIGLLAGASVASAATVGEGITFNGFLTAGATYADQKVLANTNAVSQDGNIENVVGFTNDSRLGIQLSAKVNKEVSVTGQLLARGRDENFNLQADWAFLTYRANNNLSIRGGKVKLTTFLVSDYIEVGYAYPWIRPPQEVYYANPISTINGVDALVRANFGDYSLLFQPYFGGSRGEQAVAPQEAITTQPSCLSSPPAAVTYVNCPAGTVLLADFSADSLVGVNMSFGSDVFTIRGGYLKTLVSAPAFGVSEDEARFGSIGATVDWKGMVVYSEYFARRIESAANAAFPNQQGAYATLGYRFGKWLPHATYAWLDDNHNPSNLNGKPLRQTSATLGMRYELGTGAALKFEAQQVKPEAAYAGAPTRGLLLADPDAVTSPDRNAAVMIYSLAVDVVF